MREVRAGGGKKGSRERRATQAEALTKRKGRKNVASKRAAREGGPSV